MAEQMGDAGLTDRGSAQWFEPVIDARFELKRSELPEQEDGRRGRERFRERSEIVDRLHGNSGRGRGEGKTAHSPLIDEDAFVTNRENRAWERAFIDR
jgi:hypothetical protein